MKTKTGLENEYGQNVSLKSVHLEGKLEGLLLTMLVKQRYLNDSEETIEASYTFPAGWGANLMGFSRREHSQSNHPWSLIKDSCNPRDYLDYLRHSFNRPALQEEAYEAASRYWSSRDEPRHFGKAVAALEEMATDGNEFAMFHLGRWYACTQLGQIYRNGFHGCTKDPEASRYWLKKAVALGNETACALLGRDLLEEDEGASLVLLKRGAMLGDAFAQSVLLETDDADEMTKIAGLPLRREGRICADSPIV